MPVRVNDSDRCPICRLNFRGAEALPGGADGYSIDCELCGRYEITGTAVVTLWSVDQDLGLLPYLTCYTRQTVKWGGRCAVIDSQNWRELAEAHRQTTVHQQSEKLFRCVENARGAEWVPFDPSGDYPLVDSDGADGAKYLLDYYVGLGYLEMNPSYPEVVRLTPKGWEHRASSGGGAGIRGQVFVAMSFNPKLNEAYDLGIKAALEGDCGLTPIRLDKVHHNEKICDRILVEIRRSQFTVADFTEQNQGVYFEAGFAAGIGREVIRTCREDELPGVHFDTRQYPYVTWTTPRDLREKLKERVQALKLG